MSYPHLREYGEVLGIVNQLCRRFGTSFLAPDRDAAIKAGIQRMLDREKWLEGEIAKAKEGK